MDIELPLRQRIAQSARGLACSTFSGVAGIEAGLRDPRTAGKQQVRGHSNRQFAPVDDRARKRPHRRTSGTTSESATGLQSGVAADAELEFQHFSAGGSYTVDQVFLNELSTGYDVDYRLQSPTSHLNERHCEVNELDLAESTHYVPIAETTTAGLQDAWDAHQELRTSAIERLDQLQQHLPSALSRTQLRSAEPCPGSDMSSFNHPYKPLTSRFEYHEELLPSRTEIPTQYGDSSAGNDEQSAGEFHCPYMDCHLNLDVHNSIVTLSEQRMHCVHIACDYISQTAEDWVEHVTTPHHNLQVVRQDAEVMVD